MALSRSPGWGERSIPPHTVCVPTDTHRNKKMTRDKTVEEEERQPLTSAVDRDAEDAEDGLLSAPPADHQPGCLQDTLTRSLARVLLLIVTWSVVA